MSRRSIPYYCTYRVVQTIGVSRFCPAGFAPNAVPDLWKRAPMGSESRGIRRRDIDRYPASAWFPASTAGSFWRLPDETLIQNTAAGTGVYSDFYHTHNATQSLAEL